MTSLKKSKKKKEEKKWLMENDNGIPLSTRNTRRRGSSFRTNSILLREYSVKECTNEDVRDIVDSGNHTQTPEEYGQYDEERQKYYKLVNAELNGSIDFEDSPRKTTSKFVRFFAKETKVEDLYKLLIQYWHLKPPSLLISVTGGAKSFKISSRLKRDFIEGLRKVGSTPGAWVISGGTDTGVMKMVGEANRGTENICIGVVTWGVLRHREDLEAKKPNDVHPYPREGSYLNLPEGESYLDENHTHFLLVDDGTVKNWGVEIDFRNKFEEYVMKPKKDVKGRTPTVLLVIEGGPNTFKTVNLAIETKTPCVIIKGSGRAANVIAFACEFAEKIIKSTDILPELDERIRQVVQGEDKFGELYDYALNCARNKEMFTIVDEENGVDTEDAILKALMSDVYSKKSLYDKLCFTLLWNRVDLAENMLGPLNQWVSQDEIDEEKENNQDQGETKDENNQDQGQRKDENNQDWRRSQEKINQDGSHQQDENNQDGRQSQDENNHDQGESQDENIQHQQEQEPNNKHSENQQGKEELEQLVIMALATNKVQFVSLLIDYGVSLRSLLTRQVLEILYAYRWHTRPSALREFENREIFDDTVDCTQEKKEFFSSISQSLDSNSVAQNFDEECESKDVVLRIDLNTIRNHLINELLEHVPSLYIEGLIELPVNEDDSPNPNGKFKYPYRQLFIWAVFNNMREMAVYLWQFVDDAIPMALLGVAITDNMRKLMRSRLHNVQDNEEELLTSSLTTYKDLSINLLDTCHKDEEDDTVMLVTRKSELFSKKCSALDFAFYTRQKDFVAHRAIQDILDDEWYGSIKSKHSQLRIFASIFFPPLLTDSDMVIRPPKKKRKKGGEGADKEREGVEKEGEGKEEEGEGAEKEGEGEEKEEGENENTGERKGRDGKGKEKKVGFFMKLKYFHIDSPIVKFQTHTLGYIMFLCLFAYVAMSKQAYENLCISEIILIVTVAGYTVHEFNQMTRVQVPNIRSKVTRYLSDKWNLFDLTCIITFYIGLTLRCFKQTLEVGHILYAVDVGLWIVRIIQVLYVDPISGPYVVIIGKLFKNFVGFLGILVIALASYGVTVRAILEPGPGHHQMFVAAVYKPYFHLFGELFLAEPPENTSTRFGTPKTKYNNYGEPIAVILLGAYLLTANIVLLNLLIAIFSSTYEKVIPNASRMWKFQRYKLILEYATQRTVLFPPLNLLEHLCVITYYSLKQCLAKFNCCNIQKQTGHSKAVLSVKHNKRKTDENDRKLEEDLAKLERRSFNKVIRRREEGLEMLEKEAEGGSAGIQGSAFQKHFIDQEEHIELLERHLAKIQTMIEDLKPRSNGENEKLEDVQWMANEMKYDKIAKRKAKRAMERGEKFSMQRCISIS